MVRRYLSAPLGSQTLASGRITLVFILAPVTASQLPVASLLESLSLSPYAHGMPPRVQWPDDGGPNGIVGGLAGQGRSPQLLG
jgi:hypothetical protein